MRSLLLVLSISSLAAALCSHGTTLFPRDSPAPVSSFGYDGINGPLGWYGLNTTRNSACALGRHQSPINLVPAKYPGDGPRLNFTFDDYCHGADIENLGTTLEVFINGSMTVHDPCRVPNNPPLSWDDAGACNKQYGLKQFHFHSPSEHHLDGKVYPMEVHFVFQADGAYLLPSCYSKQSRCTAARYLIRARRLALRSRLPNRDYRVRGNHPGSRSGFPQPSLLER